jgi:hypothetical protein
MYCVYLTIYFGNLLPKRYIGSSSVKRVKDGYNGSVSSIAYKEIYEQEQLNNKSLFKTRILSIHDTREGAFAEELRLQTKYNVVEDKRFMNMSVAIKNGCFGRDVSGEKNPMFGKKREGERHVGGENISSGLKRFFESDDGLEERLCRSNRMKGANNPMYGKSHSKEWIDRKKIAMTGEGNPMYGKAHSDETKKKMSQKAIGRASPNKGKKMTESQKERMRKPKTESHKKKLRNTYIVNNEEIVYNAKEYCEVKGYSYVLFTQAAKKRKLYKGMSVTLLNGNIGDQHESE